MEAKIIGNEFLSHFSRHWRPQTYPKTKRYFLAPKRFKLIRPRLLLSAFLALPGIDFTRRSSKQSPVPLRSLQRRSQRSGQSPLFASRLATKPANDWTLEITHYLASSYYNDDKHSEGDGNTKLHISGWHRGKSTIVFPKPVTSVYLIWSLHTVCI